MALPEQIANSPVPGVTTPIANSTAAFKIGESKLKVNIKPPASLEAQGQFRILMNNEIMLVIKGQSTTEWTVERKSENSIEEEHPIGTNVFHILTAGALETKFATVGIDATVGGPGGSPLSPSMVTNRLKSLGEVEGTVTPDLNEGNIFKMTIKGAVLLEDPTNWPSGYSEQLFVIRQNSAGGHKWTWGSGITSPGVSINEEPNGVTRVVLVSEDGGTTIETISMTEGREGVRGEKGIPGETGAKGEKGSIGATGPPGATGETQKLGEKVEGEVNLDCSKYITFIAELVTGATVFNFINRPSGTYEPTIVFTEDTKGNHPVSINGASPTLAMALEPSEAANSTTIVPLMQTSATSPFTIIVNKGPKGTTGAMGATGAEGKAGAWVNLTLNEAVEQNTGTLTVQGRTEGGGSVARLRGQLKVKAAKEVAANVSFLTLPSGLRPLGTITRIGLGGVSASTVSVYTIKATGEVSRSAKTEAGQLLNLDDLSWSIL